MPLMDFDRLRLVAETDDEKKSLLALFFRLAKNFTAIMENARREVDFPQWREAAHSLKGSAANLGMGVLEEACRQAEKAVGQTQEQRSALLARVRNEVAHVKAYILMQHPSLLSAGM